MIEGLDVSHWQGNINWPAVPEKYKWVAVKASEGGGFKDNKFAQNFEGVKNSGRKVIAYHYHRANAGVTFQKANWLGAIGGREIDGICLDVESQDGVSVNVLRNRVYWSLRAMEELEVPVIIYTAHWFWSSPLDGHILPSTPPGSDDPDIDPKIVASGWPLWVADYNGNVDRLPAPEDQPYLPHGWRRKDGTIKRKESARQYTSRGNVPGIAGNVDKNTMWPEYFARLGEDDTLPPPPDDLEEQVNVLEERVDDIVETLQSVE